MNCRTATSVSVLIALLMVGCDLQPNSNDSGKIADPPEGSSSATWTDTMAEGASSSSDLDAGETHSGDATEDDESGRPTDEVETGESGASVDTWDEHDDSSQDEGESVDASTEASAGAEEAGDSDGGSATDESAEAGDHDDTDSCDDAMCGNGIVEAHEECDDGNLESGDGCGSSCALEPCFPTISLESESSRIFIDSSEWSLADGDFALEFWMKSSPGARSGKIIGLNESYAVNTVQTWLTEAGEVVCNTYHGSCPCGHGSGTGNAFVTSPPLDDGEWHHVACVREGDRMAVYTDGVQGQDDFVDVSLVSSSAIAIGKMAGYQVPAAGIELGPIRMSSTARYAEDFVPAANWSLDEFTRNQYLGHSPFDGSLLPDEAPSMLHGAHDRGVVGGVHCFSDEDGDGYSALEDCDDEDASIFPGAPELCDNGVDEDCSGVADDAPECLDESAGWSECFSRSSGPTSCTEICADLGATCAERACDEGYTVWTSHDLARCQSEPTVANRFARGCDEEVFQAEDRAAMCCCGGVWR